MGANISAFFGSDYFDLEREATSPRIESPAFQGRMESPVVRESPLVQQRKKMKQQPRLSKKEKIFAKILKDRFGVNYNEVPEDERQELRERVSELTKKAKYLKPGDNRGKLPTAEDYFYAGLTFGGKTKRKKRGIKNTRKKK